MALPNFIVGRGAFQIPSREGAPWFDIQMDNIMPENASSGDLRAWQSFRIRPKFLAGLSLDHQANKSQ
jgi:hypothetical protein